MKRDSVFIVGCVGAMVIIASYLLSAPLNGNLQIVAAALLLVIYLVSTLLRPSVGLAIISATLPFLGIFRRVLYQQSPVGFDPLLLVIPIYSAFLLLVIGVSYREKLKSLMRKSGTSRLLFILIIILALQIFNPLQGGLVVGVAGALFYLVPLSWYFIGQLFLTRQAVNNILTIFIVASIIAAAYGLMQTFVGFPGYDEYWLTHGGTAYIALNVGGGAIRALGPTTSSAEYAALLAAGITCLWTLVVFRRQVLAILPAVVLSIALFLESTRTAIILTVVVCITLLVLRQKSKLVAVIVISVLCLVGAFAYQYFSHVVYAVGPDSSSPIQRLVAHQVNGLAHPFDQSYSTGQGHFQELIGALGTSLHNPLGFGLGATTLSATKFGGNSLSAELDIPNIFISGGLIAGFLYVAILYRTLHAGFTLAFRYKQLTDVLPLAVVAVTFGQILNGSYYSLMPFIWMFIAWIDCRATDILVLERSSQQPRKVLMMPLVRLEPSSSTLEQ